VAIGIGSIASAGEESLGAIKKAQEPEKSGTLIIGSDGGKSNRRKTSCDCQHPEPIQHHRPRMEDALTTAKEKKMGFIPWARSVGVDRR